MTRHGREAEHDARSLSGPQRGLHVDDGWRALMKRGSNLLHVKPPRTLDELERGIDLEPQPPPALPPHDGNAPNPAEEAIVIFESQGSASRWSDSGGCVAAGRESLGSRRLRLLLSTGRGDARHLQQHSCGYRQASRPLKCKVA